MAREYMRIMVVDDEQNYRDVLKMILTAKGYDVDTAGNGQEALDLLEKAAYDVVISDLKMPVMDGYALLQQIRQRQYDTEVIILTAFGTIEKAVETMKAGAYTYVTKGNDPEELLIELEKIGEVRRISRENRMNNKKMVGDYMLESRNDQVNQMLRLAERAAASDSNILILGESGSGKEVLASFIHRKSSRAGENFMELNCQSISESILESELFGHEKGAFTGADRRRIGHFESSDGGTLFLDEIGGISLNLQSKLLRAIENKKIYRLGSSNQISVDFRLITATNRDLKKDMEDGLFRTDLFYRISTIVLEIPPLRQRREDIPLFIDYFMKKFGYEMKKENVRMAPEVRQVLENYDYPGNIRELKNLIERLLVLSDRGEIRPEYLPMDMAKYLPAGASGTGGRDDLDGGAVSASRMEERPVDFAGSLKEYRAQAEKAYIQQLIEEHPDDMNRVAEILSISRRQLFNKLVEYGLK